jgi:hypothetical protein
MAGSSPAAGMSPSLTASQSIASSARSGIDSQGSSYGLESGRGVTTGSFSVGGAGAMNNQMLILAAVAGVIAFMFFKRK